MRYTPGERKSQQVRSLRELRSGAGRPATARGARPRDRGYMQVIATAGHVDHGKSTLVRALTGMEPDRWAEERRRGLTIDLGFAWMTLPSGRQVAFVDVPGHERFVPNMLAGVGAVPAVLFTVAADEGWMPQSEEHLAAVHALGISLRPARRDPLRPGRPGGCPPPGAGQARREQPGGGGGGRGQCPHRPGPACAPRDAWTGWPPPAAPRSGRPGPAVGGPGVPDQGERHRRDRHPPGRHPPRQAGTAADAVHGAGAGAGHRDAEAGRRPGERRGPGRAEPARRGAADPGARHGADHPGPVDAGRHGGRAPRRGGRRPPRQLTVHAGSARTAARLRPLGGLIARLTLDEPLPLHVGDRLLLRDPGSAAAAFAAGRPGAGPGDRPARPSWPPLVGATVAGRGPPAFRRREAAAAGRDLAAWPCPARRGRPAAAPRAAARR